MRDRLKLALLALSRRVDFRGKTRLLDLLAVGPNNANLAPAGFNRLACRDGIIIEARNNRDIMFRELMVNGWYQDEVLTALRHLLRPGDVFWDIGANYGFVSIFVERAFDGHVRTVSFEPSPFVLTDLRRNLELNECRHVEVQPICLSDRLGVVKFYASAENSWNATIVRGFAESTGEDIEVEVQSSTIDESVKHLSPPAVIKLDVEGAEPMVIRGGQEFLRAQRPAMIVEYNVDAIRGAGLTPEAYLAMFHDIGYRIHLLRRPWVGGYRWSSLYQIGSTRDLPRLCNLIVLSAEQRDRNGVGGLPH